MASTLPAAADPISRAAAILSVMTTSNCTARSLEESPVQRCPLMAIAWMRMASGDWCLTYGRWRGMMWKESKEMRQLERQRSGVKEIADSVIASAVRVAASVRTYRESDASGA